MRRASEPKRQALLSQAQYAKPLGEVIDLTKLLSGKIMGRRHERNSSLPVHVHQSALAVVNFENSLIFSTSNLGAHEMLKEINPHIGSQSGSSQAPLGLTNKIEASGFAVFEKRFSPFRGLLNAGAAHNRPELEAPESAAKI